MRTKSDLENDIKTLYAGKVAEEVVLGECSVGASNDLDRATHILRDYIGAYGMNSGSYLSLVGLGRENMMITANEKLLEEICTEHHDGKIYGKLCDGNAESDFLVMDIYYKMNKEEYF